MTQTSEDVFHVNHIKIKLLDSCNLRCPKCNHWRGGRDQKRDRVEALSIDEWLDFAQQAINAGVKKVRFSGGEPTLSPHLLRLCEVFLEAGVALSMTTNGTLIGRDLAKKLLQVGMKHFTFSVDGPNAYIHDQSVGSAGSFERLEAALGYLSTAICPPSISVNCVLNAVNVRFPVEMIDWAARNGVKDIHFIKMQTRHLDISINKACANESFDVIQVNNLFAYGQSKHVAVIFTGFLKDEHGGITRITEEFYKQAPCAIAREGATIYPSGDVYVCCHAKNKNLRYGNTRKKPLVRILYSSKAKEIRKVCCQPGMVIPECKDCDIQMQERYNLWVNTIKR